MYYENGKDNDKGYGPLRWFGGSRDAVSPGAALLGRGCALYDFRMDFSTDFELLVNDLHARMTKFRNVNIWTQSETNRIRKAWTSICYDHPGKGTDSVMSPDVTVEELRKWYDYQYESLSVCMTMEKLLHSLWDGDFMLMCQDLHVHGRVFHLFRTWERMPGTDVHKTFRHAFDKALHLDDIGRGGTVLSRWKENYNEADALPYRTAFIEAWKEAEDRLLSVPCPKRYLVNFEKED